MSINQYALDELTMMIIIEKNMHLFAFYGVRVSIYKHVNKRFAFFSSESNSGYHDFFFTYMNKNMIHSHAIFYSKNCNKNLLICLLTLSI